MHRPLCRPQLITDDLRNSIGFIEVCLSSLPRAVAAAAEPNVPTAGSKTSRPTVRLSAGLLQTHSASSARRAGARECQQ